MANDTAALSGSFKNRWEKTLVIFAATVISTLSMTVAYLQKQKHDEDQQTLKYERAEKEFYRKELDRCNQGRLKDIIETDQSKDTLIKRQEKTKSILKL